MSEIPAIDMSLFAVTTPAVDTPPAPVEVIEGTAIAPIAIDQTLPTAEGHDVHLLAKDIHPSVMGLLSTEPSLEELEMAGRPAMTPEQLSFMVNKLHRRMNDLDGLGHEITHKIEHVVENLLERIKHVDQRVGINAIIAMGTHLGNVAHQMEKGLQREERIRQTSVRWLAAPSTDPQDRNLMIKVTPRQDGHTAPEDVVIRFRDPTTQDITEVTNSFDQDVLGLVRTSALNNGIADGNFRWAMIVGPVGS